MPPTRNKQKHGASRSLSAGRPPILHRPAPNLSSRATRTLIQNHHRLTKEHARALASGDEERASTLQAQIDLPAYQAASKTGQSASRGGDSSKTLLTWLSPCKPKLEREILVQRDGRPFRMLEVGALSTTNACSTCGLFDVTRIDLNAQETGITKQDFMERPLPKNGGERFDILSLSLVLNYVGNAEERGEMLRRCCQFLVAPSKVLAESDGTQNLFPSLFLVLPAPCVTNSRYLDDARLLSIMESLGFALRFAKQSTKLAYYLWIWSGDNSHQADFPKMEVKPGRTRNNFAVVLKKPTHAVPR